MTAREPNAILAYWLVPAEPARNFFASTIAELASQFDAPLFEPHLTVYASRRRDENPREILSGALVDCEPFRLSIRDTNCSDKFAKSVFVQFEPNPSLSQLSRALQHASATHAEYELNPHLSLIYKKMTREQKIDIAASIRLSFTEVVFDSARVIVSPRSIRSRADVEAWRVVAAQTMPK